ncbi:hypothetical protein MY652_03065 [Haemophilus influenzae]|uniref:hypothetical protein n=1 Tax=Haemophilus influenzae TaxID=727 RepID=UPI00014FC98C|nr:hypothetical protein [Haemophilus influenzae]EDK09550.1 hypothetical protein CGSHiHH_00573 [Haemophilus influenzae PittHH]KIP37249.1 hypothetical protein SU30_01560 [Haemophilus influenzae]KIP48831.1 hypothetical protein SU59_06115 [Haemophilus influenzae]KMZ32766.1 hypothetical protein ABN30_02805 [Haemophilus influenzae]MBZ5691709.1 hypothetical protein [Haemophilus influenzae]
MKKYLLTLSLILTACTDVETCNLQCQKERANAEWKQEQGEFQPNLTPEQERYIVEWLVEHYPNGTQP